jgi:hypothetical protein
VNTDPDGFVREWSLRWAEGVMLGLARARLEPRRAFGMLRTARRKFRVTEKDLGAILFAIENSPRYLPGLTQRQKATKLKPIREAIENGEI